MKIIITGATGLIGKEICRRLINRGDEIIIFTRSPENARVRIAGATEYVKWNYKEINNEDCISIINNADAIIHLAGENVMAKRWNDEHKKKILESRVLGTRSLVNAVSKVENKPKAFISASAVGYYGTGGGEVAENSEPGNDFLADVTKKWETEVRSIKESGTREVRIRIGIVLDKNEGALARMITPFQLFIGGPPGSGNQPFPWIHIDDVAGIFLHALDNESLSGALNAVAPEKITMNEFSKVLGRTLKRPSFFKVPEIVMRLVLGEAAGVIVSGNFVIPNRTLESGYNFKYENVETALNDLLKM